MSGDSMSRPELVDYVHDLADGATANYIDVVCHTPSAPWTPSIGATAPHEEEMVWTGKVSTSWWRSWVDWPTATRPQW